MLTDVTENKWKITRVYKMFQRYSSLSVYECDLSRADLRTTSSSQKRVSPELISRYLIYYFVQNHKALCTSNIFFSYPFFYNMVKQLSLTVLPSQLWLVFYFSNRLMGSLFLKKKIIKMKFASVNKCKNSFCYIFKQVLRTFFVCHLHASRANETAEPEISVMT